jgi:hypothetical protein
MTRLLALAALVSGACTDLPGGHDYFCVEGETCSHDTPYGLDFRGTDITGELGGEPGVLAIGGIEHIRVLDPSDDLTQAVPFARKYTTDTSQRADNRFALGVEAVEHDGNIITVRGIADGTSYLRLLAPDGKLYDRTALAAVAVDHRQVRPPYAYGGPGASETIVWAPGAHDISVGLWSPPDPELENTSDLLVDESLVLEVPGATQTRWDTLHVPAAAAGHRALVVTGGSGAAVLDVETVAAPDSIENRADNYYPISIYGSNRLCFVARNASRYVAGVEWSFTMDDGEVLTDEGIDTRHSGCAYFAPHLQGAVHIHATASGYTQTLDVTAH